MTRSLYRCLLRLHPPAFRDRFAEEMLGIFDEAAAAEGVVPLFADGLISLLRQWVMRSGMWKVAVAGLGGFIPIAIGFASLVNWPATIGAVASAFGL